MKKNIPKIEFKKYNPQDIIGLKKTRKILEDKKDEIILYGGIFIGILFLISGILYLNSPVKKVADNVIFGEHAVMAIFLMIIGILVIVTALKEKIISKTPLADMYTEMKAIENEKDKKDKKNNIE
ncbi:hypothetical protein [Methanothermobacter tenebrarum]|uniref:Uncharacterized protein n=1 Tax=Methanothermobacter tenebrarum TaxID=680118 RepID=A0A328PJZ4_9EURY|nr:hypothetical protein [Methanothermobacter tenebrarum]NPV65310.1 hypothetical protein [Methanobacteriaceae archaeon]RAO79664.1 hypothetical protein DPC56_02565 [Methanothermobacter tenebrarum]